MNNSIVRSVIPAAGSPLVKPQSTLANSLSRRLNPPPRKVPVRRPATARQPQFIVHKQSSGIKFHNSELSTKFNPNMLDLGNLNTPCEEKNAIAAVFDITDFTKFCNQVDAYLEIPRFLNYFLKWFFGCIVEGLTEEDDGIRSTFWADLPILVKFLGDGLLIVWNSQRMTSVQTCRLIATLYNICRAYNKDFYPQISTTINKPPSILRCGVARGRVFSIGGGRDYVGHCINNASRLSHMDGLTFGFPHRGFDVHEAMPEEYARLFIPKYVSIKGVGENEMVWILKEEYDRMPEDRKKHYRSFEETPALGNK